MVRRLAVFALVALTGCSGLRDAFTGHQDVVAKVGSHELTAEMLAQTVAGTKQIPLQAEVLDRIAEIWVEYQLLGQAVGGGDSLMDSATVAAANWPLISQRLADKLHDTLIVGRATITDAAVDSAYSAGNQRYIYHLLVSVRPDTTDNVKAAKRRAAEGYLAQIRRGTDFATLAGQHSDDPGSKPNGGRLGMVSRGVMVKPFEDAAFALEPGQVSGIVETQFGYHILWRPALAAVRDSFTASVREAAVGRLDSLYLDSLTNRTDIRVRGSAPARARFAAANMREAKTGSRVMATYHGGRMRERDFARWLQAYPAQVRAQIGQAPDSVLSEFVKSLARNDMLLRSAAQMHIRLASADWDSIRSNYRREMVYIEGALGVSPESLAADSTARTDRVGAAARRVDSYFRAITSPNNQRPYVEVPPFLADILRARTSWRISRAGIDRAVDQAKAIRGPETPMAPSPNNPMTPAPGGPPTGGPGGAAPGRPRRTIR